MGSFDGKVALVTGGGSGLGEAIGNRLAAGGARVVLSDINLKAAVRVAGEISASGGKASAFMQDTARPEDSETAPRKSRHSSASCCLRMPRS